MVVERLVVEIRAVPFESQYSRGRGTIHLIEDTLRRTLTDEQIVPKRENSNRYQRSLRKLIISVDEAITVHEVSAQSQNLIGVVSASS